MPYFGEFRDFYVFFLRKSALAPKRKKILPWDTNTFLEHEIPVTLRTSRGLYDERSDDRDNSKLTLPLNFCHKFLIKLPTKIYAGILTYFFGFSIKKYIIETI